MEQRVDAAQNWHSLTPHEVAAAFTVNPDDGLPEKRAAEILLKEGLNRLAGEEKRRWHHMMARQFSNVLVFILLIAAILSFALGDILDAAAILAIIVLNGLLGFIQEWKAQTALKSLKKMLSPECRVIRDGKTVLIKAEHAVPGDIVLLESGNMVPADIRLIETVNLRADESALTGESAPIEKNADALTQETPLAQRRCMVFAGTHIVNGRGKGIIVATGMRTEFGWIARLTEQIRETQTRLQRQLSRLGKQLAALALSTAALMAVTGLLWGKPLMQMFMAGVSLAVAAVPEGLPAVVTITLALGVGALARRKALLRHLQAAETLGATSVICTDKTGTLTANEMTLRHLWTADDEIEITGTGYAPEGSFLRNGKTINPQTHAVLPLLLETACKCGHAGIVQREGRWMAAGQPTEAAFMVAARKAGIKETTPVKTAFEFSFNSSRKRMSIVEEKHNLLISHVKGAPEILLTLSDKIMIGGKEEILDEKRRDDIKNAYQHLAGNGLRTMALARKTLAKDTAIDESTAESGLTFLGIAGIMDPPRPEVPAAIEETYKAGIRILMITGDSPDTALSIAKQIGLRADKALTGADLSDMNDETLSVLLKEEIVFARTTPEDKYRIVKLLQAQNQIVGMTGDGVNDAPALKQADIGIAMGVRGTDVARGAADMVLMDDNFATIVAAIAEGRRQYTNIAKSVCYLTSSNIGETLAIFINVLLGLPLILLPIQILWVNLVTDSVSALSLGMEKAESNIMTEPPRALAKPILDRTAFAMLGFFGSYIALAVLGIFFLYLETDYALANTAAFTAMVTMANLHTLNFRSFHKPHAQIGWSSNPALLLAISAMIALQVLAVHTSFLRETLNIVPLEKTQWIVIIAVSLPIFAFGEIYKTIKTGQNHS